MSQDKGVVACAPRALVDASMRDLLAEAIEDTTELAKKQIELAVAEIRRDAQREIRAAKVLGVAALCGVSVVNLLLVAAVLALSNVLEGWGAALIVAAALLVIGGVTGLVGWSMRVKSVLERSQRTIREDIQWAKERIA